MSHRRVRPLVVLVGIALCCLLLPAAGSGRVITAKTNRGGSCRVVTSVARGMLIDYSAQVASSTCKVATRIRHVASVGLLYDETTHEQVDSAPWKGTGLPYNNSGDYTPNPVGPPPPGEVDDQFRSRFDLSVLLACPSRPGPPGGAPRGCVTRSNTPPERWINPGSPCRVASKYRARDRLICRLQDQIPF